MKKQSDLHKLMAIAKQHAEIMYNIALDKLQRDKEKFARKGDK